MEIKIVRNEKGRVLVSFAGKHWLKGEDLDDFFFEWFAQKPKSLETAREFWDELVNMDFLPVEGVVKKVGQTVRHMVDGLCHKEDGPAETKPGVEKWLQNGRLHREDGPAVVYTDGSKEEYWNDGKLHREDGPAIIEDGYQAWYEHGKLIREEEED